MRDQLIGVKLSAGPDKPDIRLETALPMPRPPGNGDNKHTKSDKIILLWNSFWDMPGWGIGLGGEPFQRLRCPVKNCQISEDRSRLNESDAILFHIHQLKADDRPRFRFPHQRWVFWMLESPGWSHNYQYQKWNGLFNWTMTYRLDSDVRLYYGRYWERPSVLKRDLNEVVKSKSRLIAWISSNCQTHSRRFEYVTELEKYIPIDKYGRCGNMTCKKEWDKDDQACLKMVGRMYKFYLSFENAFCKDYVTEKYFKIIPLDTVPVVRGAADYSKFGPPQSYVNAADFRSPKELAGFLIDLDKNDTKYIQYLETKNKFDGTGYFGVKWLPSWCELCAKLNNDSEPRKTYERIDKWWSQSDCAAKNDISNGE
ncbi:alpha-(1,3)-fucosyltransferase C-like [Lingula anatina]|uniref:Fucosyltransferase n=1 Tax=Lingula anatina TaxID=7574 RepID=A0A1S3I6S4_LINAN|nr:alpha-(1,3)-fucosyltransferase C-like [Lingula anatina]|eukprot:XP_013393546.1 alpha-(1,3)-fucosyltransferase C-like [Lingula anatina]